MLHQYPICWECEEPVEYDPVFEALCGHEECPSNVFHGICLFDWRDKREEVERRIRQHLFDHFGNRPPPEDN